MGLDMYLEARKYVNKIDWNSVPQQRGDGTPINWGEHTSEAFKALRSMFPEELTKHNEAGSSVAINVGYWRKANQIHGWFVREVQGGEDNCESYPVSREKLVELLDTVRKVLDGDKSVARELLPVTSGFFFGNYDEDDGYDEWYYEHLKHTETMLSDILDAVPEEQHLEYDFYYQSSW
jgi:hypothetical protein